MVATKEKMGIRFREIMLKLVFIEMIKYIINRIEDRMTIIQINDKFPKL